MGNTYFSTFITGLQEIVETALKRDLKDAKIIKRVYSRYKAWRFNSNLDGAERFV